MSHILSKLAVVAALVLLPFAALAAQSPETVSGATTISPAEAVQLFDEGVAFIDVRKPSDY